MTITKGEIANTCRVMGRNGIYVCGPMFSYPEFNRPRFAYVAALLRKAHPGMEVYNPGEHYFFCCHEALATEIPWIARNARVMALLEGHEDSKGGKAEKALCDALRPPIPYKPFWQLLPATLREVYHQQWDAWYEARRGAKP